MTQGDTGNRGCSNNLYSNKFYTHSKQVDFFSMLICFPRVFSFMYFTKVSSIEHHWDDL